jgi:hypothetical protein
MSSSIGNDSEMTKYRKLDGTQAEALITGQMPDDPVGRIVARLRMPDRVDDATAAEHIAAAAEASRLAPVHNRALRRYRWRRRTVFGSFITTVLAKVLAASVALAAVTGGVGAVANSAAPGDPLYGVDTAMERIGLFNGGIPERLQEAERLVTRNQVYRGLELAGSAIGGLRDGYGSAAAALEQAAVQVQTRTQTSEQYRDDVTEMLRIMTRQMQQQQVNQVTETAEQVRETTREMVNQPDSLDDVTTSTTCDGCGSPSTTCAGCGDQGPGAGDGHNGDDNGQGGNPGNMGGNGGGGH